MIGIYKITSPSGKVYVGSSVNVERRFKNYKSLDCKKQVKLYRSFLKYGVNAHKFEILIECSVEDLRRLEAETADKYDALNSLNCRVPKVFEQYTSVSDSTRNKISLALSGKKKSEAHKQKLRDAKGLGFIPNYASVAALLESVKKRKKIILNMENGIFYCGASEACEAHSLNRNYLYLMLRSVHKNKTSLVLV
jgi:group I intron endonuclease